MGLMPYIQEIYYNYPTMSPLFSKRSQPMFRSHTTIYIAFCLLFLQCVNVDNSRQQYQRHELLEYARKYANTDSKRDWNDEYWDMIGEFDNIEDFYETMRLVREFSFPFSLSEDYWYWEDESFRQEYRQRRSKLK